VTRGAHTGCSRSLTHMSRSFAARGSSSLSLPPACLFNSLFARASAMRFTTVL